MVVLFAQPFLSCTFCVICIFPGIISVPVEVIKTYHYRPRQKVYIPQHTEEMCESFLQGEMWGE